jgi:hypothetical protein
VILMADPITLAIASAVAGKATEALSDQAKQTVAAIARRIREKFRGHPAELATLDAAKNDHARIEELAVLLDEASAEDPEFGSQIRELWIQGCLMATDGGVVNLFHGKADKVIQLRDVHGDLNIS